MQAVVYNGKDAVYRTDYKKPVRKEGESLVRILLAAVCNTDKEVRLGYKPDFKGVMGHEFVGVVEESDREELIGKRVVGELNEACGHCVYCKTGRPSHCSNRRVIGLHEKDGCFAEYMTIATELLHIIPDELATVELTTQVAFDVRKNCAVIGDGRLSLMITEVLSLYGMDLTVIGRHREKLDKFLPYAKVTTDGQTEGYEYVIDATGRPEGLGAAMQYVRKKGTIVLKSTYAGNTAINMSEVVVNELTIVGSRCGPFEPALKLLQRGLIQLPEIELHALSDFENAFSSKAFKAGFSFLKQETD